MKKKFCSNDVNLNMLEKVRNEKHFNAIRYDANGNPLNEQLNGYYERYEGSSPIIDIINNLGKENQNKNGVPIYYIPTYRNGKKDKILGTTTEIIALGLFKGMKFLTDADSMPIFNSIKDDYDYINSINDFMLYSHKNDFKEKSELNIQNYINRGFNKIWGIVDNKYLSPKAGDILIIDNDYYPMMELTSVKDDDYLYFDKRDYWTVYLQHYTKNIGIDFSVIEKELIDMGLERYLLSYINEDNTKPNHIISTNDDITTDERNRLHIPKDKKGKTEFDKMFKI